MTTANWTTLPKKQSAPGNGMYARPKKQDTGMKFNYYWNRCSWQRNPQIHYKFKKFYTRHIITPAESTAIPRHIAFIALC